MSHSKKNEIKDPKKLYAIPLENKPGGWYYLKPNWRNWPTYLKKNLSKKQKIRDFMKLEDKLIKKFFQEFEKKEKAKKEGKALLKKNLKEGDIKRLYPLTDEDIVKMSPKNVKKILALNVIAFYMQPQFRIKLNIICQYLDINFRDFFRVIMIRFG